MWACVNWQNAEQAGAWVFTWPSGIQVRMADNFPDALLLACWFGYYRLPWRA